MGLIELPKWASRTAALALLALLLGSAYMLLVAPVVGAYRSTDEATQHVSDQLARYGQLSKAYPNRKAQLERLDRQQARSGIYLAGETDALAAAALQEDVSAKIERSGGTIRSIQTLPVKTDGDFKKVGIRVQLTAKLGSLARILHALEAGKPYVFIDNLDVKNRRGRKARQAQQDDPELIIRFDLHGYLRPELG